MAAAAMKKRRIQEEEEEANTLSTQMPDDKEGLLEFMDQRAKSIQHCKDQIQIFETKLAEERKLMADAETKFLQIDRVESDTFFKTKPNVAGKTGTLFSIPEFRSEGDKVKKTASNGTSTSQHVCGETKMEYEETSTPLPRSEKNPSKLPSILLPPSFKRKASAPVRPEVNETTQAAQPTVTRRSFSFPREEGKRSNEVVREAQAHIDKGFAKPRMRVSSNISGGQARQDKSEFHGHDELIALIGRSSLRPKIESRIVSMLPSGHTKRMRSLAVSLSNRDLFATSALDCVVHFWKLQSNRSSATLFKTVNRVGLDQKRWAEDIAWHPHRSELFSVYTADDGHAQVSSSYLNQARESCESKFLKDRPHSKGLINRIMFTPWDDDPCFITGGCDHAVVLWREQCGERNAWKSRLLHRDLHSSSVMGVAGMRHKNHLVLSCGDDKRFVGFDARAEKATFTHRLDNRCTNLLPNPRDVNLVMVHTRQLDRQLRLYDVRLPQTELFSFGWKQESSESQSALINQSWSPDGLHISSGSSDPVIHIFDIRYNAPSPSLSIKAHKRRVFKAEWQSSQQLVSISSNLEIGIHKIW
ncbi:unnamed protein product [Eruca vesicaria subsp. sativa]|uniref:Uncharacterized protein n=1 Tax=Eruca vesicaria subsp. sativa TaxID=29727 RepID=A0ABC8M2X5_ERUVS|nr:unnamed protein product [Eruca vesicaria subsp. sativa]